MVRRGAAASQARLFTVRPTPIRRRPGAGRRGHRRLVHRGVPLRTRPGQPDRRPKRYPHRRHRRRASPVVSPGDHREPPASSTLHLNYTP